MSTEIDIVERLAYLHSISPDKAQSIVDFIVADDKYQEYVMQDSFPDDIADEIISDSYNYINI